jgi:hypothetical protein
VEPTTTTTTSNPYDRLKQEAMFLAFEHGFNSQDELENPYADMPEMREASTAWSRGYRANKKRAKRIKPSPLSDLEKQPLDVDVQQAPDEMFIPQVPKPTSSNVNLKDISTEVLLAEVLNRVREVDKVMEQMRRIFK